MAEEIKQMPSMEAESTRKKQLIIRGIFVTLILAMHGFFLGSALINQSYLTDDSIQYLTLAENMAQKQQFSQSYDGALISDLQRTPGYPLFLVLLFRSPILVLIVQHLLVLAAGGMVYLLVKEAHNARLGRAMAVLYLLQPYPKIFASMILSETLFIFFLLVAVFYFIRFWRMENVWALTFSLLGLCIAIHIRPVALPLLLLGLILMGYKLFRLGKKSIQLLPTLLIPLLLIGGWMLRNERLSGKWIFSNMGGMGMVHGRIGGLEAMRLQKGTGEHALYMAGDSVVGHEIGLTNIRIYPDEQQTHETESFAPGLTKMTFSFFLKHPIDALLFQGKCFYEMFKGVGYGWAKAVTHSESAATVSAAIQFLLNCIVYLGLLSALFRIHKWRFQETLSFGIVVVVLLVSAAAWADGRYRVVIDPIFLLLLSFVLWNFEQKQRLFAQNGASEQ